MCTTCGCSQGAQATLTDPATGQRLGIGPNEHHHHGHDHHHDHDEHHHGHEHGPHEHSHQHAHGHGSDGTTLTLEQEVLAKNNLLAERNRGWLEGRDILALNLVSSPGAGKTTLLEQSICDLVDFRPVSVVEGDQETVHDAERIRATGAATVQVNTGTGCHLEADMMARALTSLDPPMGSVLFIENVGNLVCPALFDLGEAAKVVMLSVTEGDDKPLKYPHMFRAASLMVLTKSDLLPHVDFDIDACIGHARRVNPDIEAMTVSARGGDGLDQWYDWLRARLDSGRSVA